MFTNSNARGTKRKSELTNKQMNSIHDVHPANYGPLAKQDLLYDASVYLENTSKTNVLICGLPQEGTLLKTQYQILDQSCCPRFQLAFWALLGSSTLLERKRRAADESR